MHSESSVSSTFAVVYVLVNKAWSVTGDGWTEVHFSYDCIQSQIICS